MKKQRGKKWRGRYHFYLVVISPHHSRAISLQGKSDITLEWWDDITFTL